LALHMQVAETNIGIFAHASNTWPTVEDPINGPGLGVGLDYGEAQVPGGEAQLLGVYPPRLPVPVNVALGSVLIHGVATGAGGGGLGAGALGGVPEPTGPEVVPVPTVSVGTKGAALEG